MLPILYYTTSRATDSVLHTRAYERYTRKVERGIQHMDPSSPRYPRAALARLMDDHPPLAHPPEPPPSMPTVMPSCTRCALRMDTIGLVSWSLAQQPGWCPCMATRHPGRSYNPRSRRWLTCGGCGGDGNVGVPVYTVKEQCPGCVIDGVLISHREVVVERDNPAAERRRVRERARAEAMARARARGPRGRGGRRRSRGRGGLSPPPPPGCAGCRHHWREPPAPSRMVRIVRWLFAAPSWRVAAPRYRRRPFTPPFWRSSVSRDRRRFTPSYRGSYVPPRRAYRGTSVSSYDSPYDTPYERPYKTKCKRQYRRKYSRPPQRNRRGPHKRRHQRSYQEDYRRPRDSCRGPWA